MNWSTSPASNWCISSKRRRGARTARHGFAFLPMTYCRRTPLMCALEATRGLGVTSSRVMVACLVLIAGRAWAASDPSFLLSANLQDLNAYFPGQIANGYFSTMTAPRGPEGNLAYMGAFMDYAKGDGSRPAAIPGWTEIDYSTGPSHAGQFWLNQV